MRSSIFSSESLKSVKAKRPITLVCVILGVLLLEGVVRGFPDELLLPAHGWLGEYTFVEARVLPAHPEPRVLVFGSSRVKEGFSPGHAERAVGLPEGSLLNLGMRGGRPSDYLRLYRRNREQLRTAKVALVGVDEWHFSSGFLLDPRSRMTLPWADRWAIASTEAVAGLSPARQEALAQQREKLLLDGAFGLRLRTPYLLKAVPMQLGLRKARGQHMTPDRMVVPDRPSRDGAGIEMRLSQHYTDFDQHPLFVNHLRQIVQLLQEDGLRVVLFQMPNRSDYQALVDEQHAEAYATQLATTQALADELGVPFFHWKRPAECGLSDDDYRDYGHMELSGAEAFGEFLSGFVKAQGLLEDPR
jgi:hypothetical protein